MKFTNIVVVFSVMSIALLSSCSSLSPVVEAEKSISETAAESLTPMQIKTKALHALPNLYTANASEHKSDTETRSQFKAALALKQQGRFPKAREVLITLSEQHSNLSGIWLQLALLSKEQDKNNAEQRRTDMHRYLKNAISANPLNYLAHNELAQVLRQQGQFHQALSHYELAIKSWPAYAEAYLNRGILFDLYMGRKSLALADYELYQALSNDDSRQLKGWIIDLQRQIKSAQQATQTGVL